jgi:6-phosphogluconolactonase
MTHYRLIVATSAEDLAQQAAERIAASIDQALSERDRAQIALAGGSTPRSAYVRLGTERLPWDRVDVLLGDERWVPSHDPASNSLMLAQTLLAQEPASQARFHPVPVDAENPAAAAEAYAAMLAAVCPGTPPCFDLILLGLGDDGHTASLFPGTASLGITDRWVCVGEGKGMPRISLTAPVLSAARQVIFLVSGADKSQALSRMMDPQESQDRTPARLVQPNSDVIILADAAAAAHLV